MSETLADDGPVAKAESRIWDILLVNVDVDVPTAQGRQQLLRRSAHYRNAPPVPIEPKVLEGCKEKRLRSSRSRTTAR